MGNCVKTIRLATGINVPCGKCYACLQKRVAGWSFRLRKEAERSSSALFITLTYSDETVPISSNGELTLRKTDLQKFFKRLRKLNEEKIKYYAVGEYGTKTQRPHYHAILFNADKETIQQAWNINDEQIGETHIGDVNPSSIGYTLKYINKGTWKPQYELDDRDSEFAVMSKKMGDNYLTDKMILWHQLDETNRYYIPEKDGKKTPLPRYYKEKLYSQEQRERISEKLMEKVEKLYKLQTIEEVVQEEKVKIEKHRKHIQRQKEYGKI